MMKKKEKEKEKEKEEEKGSSIASCASTKVF